ncbi:FAD-binding domain-containing protein [Trichocladium antarcticum]|uniref:Delta(24)-sterol reductase n=1 Tax=Trichocladium antarcticum TaxID=1450529 RepID=A0AAN6ULB4_9PEZI|nr:FAD-binding domain-containing protein [Trichocladium antarcticum]
MASSHETAVNQIAAAVRAFSSQREPFRIFHGSTNSTRPAHDGPVVDISGLDRVLKIDENSRTAVVEPNVPMDKLVAATLARGFIPPVVMEFPGITVGGGFAGSAGESSSFRYGYFDQTVRSVEMVLATGDVVRASPSENPDLFQGAAGTAGTLGIATKLELSLIPAKRFVKLEYHRYNTVSETIAAVRRATEDAANDYVDGIIFSKTLGLVMTGQLTDDIPPSTTPQTFSGAWDPWFYLHASQQARKCPPHNNNNNNNNNNNLSPPPTDYIPLAEYLFRYDRGGFWVGARAFAYFPFVPFNRVTRWFTDDFMHTRMLYRALQGSNMAAGNVVQDLSLPYPTAGAFVDHTAETLAVWPLWLCPLRATRGPTFHPSSCSADGQPQPMLNIGLWGAAADAVDVFVAQNRALEAKLTELGGRKVLYSQTFYEKAEFWSLYDAAWYDGLREKYGATTLPSVYDKVHVDAGKMRRKAKGRGRWAGRLAASGVWPLPGLRGIYCAIKSRDYLIHRQPCWTYWNGVGAK